MSQGIEIIIVFFPLCKVPSSYLRRLPGLIPVSVQGTGIANCTLEHVKQAYPVTACHVFHVGISVQNTNSPSGRHLALPAPPSPVTPEDLRYIHCDKFNNRWLHGLCYKYYKAW